MKERKLPPLQQRFVEEYSIDLNAFEAARRAGYSDPNWGRQVLAKPSVKKAVEARLEILNRKATVTAERCIQEVCSVAFLDPAEITDKTGTTLLNLRQMPEHVRRAVSSVKVKRIKTIKKGSKSVEVDILEYRFWNKLDAQEKLFKYLGIYNEPKKIPEGDGSSGNSRTFTDAEKREAVRRFLGWGVGSDVAGESLDEHSSESAGIHGESAITDGTDESGPLAGGITPLPL